jgi:hypothetical protein
MTHLYRYRLERDLVPGITQPRLLGFCMLNPSTADHMKDDPTIRKCKGFAVANGFTGIRICNLYPLRATDPKELLAAAEMDRCGHPEEQLLAWAWVADCDTVVLAWGSNGRFAPQWVSRATKFFQERCRNVVHLGRTKSGEPRHPLMVSYRQEFKICGY